MGSFNIKVEIDMKDKRKIRKDMDQELIIMKVEEHMKGNLKAILQKEEEYINIQKEVKDMREKYIIICVMDMVSITILMELL